MKSPKLTLSVIICVFLLAGVWSFPEGVGEIPNPKSRDNTWVTDLPGALQSSTVSRLNELINQVEADTTAEIAVVVIHSLEGKSIEDFATQLFNLWGIGKHESNNGLLFLWSVNDRQLRIEVGDGLRELIPDSRAGAVLDRYVVPRFKEGNFDEGVMAGVGALVARLRNDPTELPPEAVASYTREERSSGGSFLSMILTGLGGLAATLGGLLGFGRWRRNHPRKCPSCGTRMARLSEAADDASLAPGQRVEERLKSVDYDVWRCPSCQQETTLRYPKWFAKHGKCPQCHHKTCLKTQKTVRRASTISEGLARVTEDCQFCTYHRTYDKSLPRISPSDSGSSSSSSSGSSSFGGGSSSGGGSSRGY